MRASYLCVVVPSLWLFLFSIIGCRDKAVEETRDIQIAFSLRPDPPRVGTATAVIELTDQGGAPLKGAQLKLEGNMNHAGMKPVFADAKETEPGKYEAALDFTMGGDWFVLITGTLADGRKLNRKVDVPRVKSR